MVADEPDDIAHIVADAADRGARLVVTTGGTGLGPRDRTPEAVEGIVDHVVPGFGEAMRAEGRTHTPLASLSRSLGAVRGRTLILCLPGSPRGALESLDGVDMILAHALDTLAGRTAHT
jgi:molybdenum cofactor synthesis domain-containing protein